MRELELFTWSTAARHLSGEAAERFGLGDRGMLAPGAVADLVVVDGRAISDHATYAHPRRLADGIDDVFVAGAQVLAAGALTRALPGQGTAASGRLAGGAPATWLGRPVAVNSKPKMMLPPPVAKNGRSTPEAGHEREFHGEP